VYYYIVFSYGSLRAFHCCFPAFWLAVARVYIPLLFSIFIFVRVIVFMCGVECGSVVPVGLMCVVLFR